MDCIFCQAKTRVVNSRKRGRSVWRRRQCTNDHIFTSYEAADASQLSIIKADQSSEQFKPAKLLLSLAAGGMSADEASSLQATIVDKLFTELAKHPKRHSLHSKLIAELTYQTLELYDPNYAARYLSYSSQLDR